MHQCQAQQEAHVGRWVDLDNQLDVNALIMKYEWGLQTFESADVTTHIWTSTSKEGMCSDEYCKKIATHPGSTCAADDGFAEFSDVVTSHQPTWYGGKDGFSSAGRRSQAVGQYPTWRDWMNKLYSQTTDICGNIDQASANLSKISCIHTRFSWDGRIDEHQRVGLLLSTMQH